MKEKNNSIINALREGPKTIKELPYMPSSTHMSIDHAKLIRKIKVTGRVNKSYGKSGNFKTVYYLKDDISAAINKFVEINGHILKGMNLKDTQGLHSGLPKGIGKMIIARFKELQS